MLSSNTRRTPGPWITVCAIVVSVIAGCGEASSRRDEGPPWAEAGLPDGVRRYGLESAVIEYEISGWNTGHETLSFDRWGAREASVSRLDAHGMDPDRTLETVTEGAWVTTIDHAQRELFSMKAHVHHDAVLQEATDALAHGERVDWGELTMRAYGCEPVGREPILGRSCQVWERETRAGHERSWLWEGILLKHERVMGDGTPRTYLAVRIEEQPALTDALFELPRSYPRATFDPTGPGVFGY